MLLRDLCAAGEADAVTALAARAAAPQGSRVDETDAFELLFELEAAGADSAVAAHWPPAPPTWACSRCSSRLVLTRPPATGSGESPTEPRRNPGRWQQPTEPAR